MNNTIREAIILATVFVVVMGSALVGARTKKDYIMMSIIMGLFGTGIVAISLFVTNIKKKTADESFYFEISDAKKCAPGPYMRSSNPALQKLCENVTKEEIAQFACGKGFSGRPVHWEYTPMSDAKWNNPINCNDIGYNYPCPL